MEDKELKELNQYYGSLQYHKGWLNVNLTDGVAYICKNGYTWLMTDSISVIKTLPKILKYLEKQNFLVVKLNTNLQEHKAVMTIEDGNNNILYDLENLVMYYQNNVMMLSGEY